MKDVKVDCSKSKAWVVMKKGKTLEEKVAKKAIKSAGKKYSLTSFKEVKGKESRAP